jgi:hypothetical protein
VEKKTCALIIEIMPLATDDSQIRQCRTGDFLNVIFHRQIWIKPHSKIPNTLDRSDYRASYGKRDVRRKFCKLLADSTNEKFCFRGVKNKFADRQPVPYMNDTGLDFVNQVADTFDFG